MSSPNYLEMICYARSLEKIATYIRGQTCHIVATIGGYDDGQRIVQLVHGEAQAQAIEQCHDLAQARILLHTWKYL